MTALPRWIQTFNIHYVKSLGYKAPFLKTTSRSKHNSGKLKTFKVWNHSFLSDQCSFDYRLALLLYNKGVARYVRNCDNMKRSEESWINHRNYCEYNVSCDASKVFGSNFFKLQFSWWNRRCVVISCINLFLYNIISLYYYIV